MARFLYFDLETIPDDSRIDLFNLPELPEEVPETALENCQPPEKLLAKSIDALKQELLTINPVEEYLNRLRQAELQGKARAGVSNAIDDTMTAKNAHENTLVERNKIMSITPEYCRIASLGYAIDDDAVNAITISDLNSVEQEKVLLNLFWEMAEASTCRHVVGFNILNFDLPVIFFRSALLGVTPTRQFDLRPWGNDVIDLMAKRWPKSKAMRLKDTCQLCGIDVPAGDFEGSQVYEAMQAAEGRELVTHYAKSDVYITRELHRFYASYFC